MNWTKLHTGQLHDFYSPHIIRTGKSRMRLAGNAILNLKGRGNMGADVRI
jgi:hypothetical protein